MAHTWVMGGWAHACLGPSLPGRSGARRGTRAASESADQSRATKGRGARCARSEAPRARMSGR
eukprot:6055351-Lingulodinium_polyedra.AAC.1